jgi:hypothetical protein
MTIKPWTDQKRLAIKSKIDKAAQAAAKTLGAEAVTIIAFFAEGDFLHMQDGGTSPMPSGQLYERLAEANGVKRTLIIDADDTFTKP